MTSSSNDASDVPPLEDMSHVFKQTEATATVSKLSSPKSAPKPVDKTTEPAKASFGGMRRGFLFAPSSSSNSSNSSNKHSVGDKHRQAKQSRTDNSEEDEVPFIRSNPEAAAKSLRLDDVQASLAEAEAAGSGAGAASQWLTEELLAKVESDEALLRGLANPRMSAALAKFQSNPRMAMEEYKDDTEVQAFLAKFSALLGEHFTRIADQQEKEKQQQQQPPPVDTDVAEVLARPGVREALTNPDVQRWMSLLREDPDRAQGLLRQSRDADFQRRIRLLFENGLIGLAK